MLVREGLRQQILNVVVTRVTQYPAEQGEAGYHFSNGRAGGLGAKAGAQSSKV